MALKLLSSCLRIPSTLLLAYATLCVSLILLIPVAVSHGHIIERVYLYELVADAHIGFLKTEVLALVKFGVWGYCATGGEVE